MMKLEKIANSGSEYREVGKQVAKYILNSDRTELSTRQNKEHKKKIKENKKKLLKIIP